MKKYLETFIKGFTRPRDQLSAIAPDEYAERFVRFIRANIKTKEQAAREKEEESSSEVVLTVQQQEDRRVLEKAQKQLQRESFHKRMGLDATGASEQSDQMLRDKRTTNQKDPEKTGSENDAGTGLRKRVVQSTKDGNALSRHEKTPNARQDGYALQART